MRLSVKVAALLTLVLTTFGGLYASSGYVVDPEGRPLKGARICYMLADAEGLCTETDARGYYAMPQSPLDTVRITATGYLSRFVAAAPQESAIQLERAASLLIKLVDAETGGAIASGELIVTYSRGDRRGPFPVNQAGVRVRGLRGGSVVLTASAAGYQDTRSTLELAAGEQKSSTIELQPAP